MNECYNTNDSFLLRVRHVIANMKSVCRIIFFCLLRHTRCANHESSCRDLQWKSAKVRTFSLNNVFSDVFLIFFCHFISHDFHINFQQMEKSLYIEPTGNEFSLKCKLESKVSDENTILWFQLLDDGKSTDDITLGKLNRILNGSKEMTLAAFESFQTSFGNLLYPQEGEDRKATRLKNSKHDDLISFSKNGQRIKFQPIQESLNGFYTCMYAETCTNTTTKVVIGKTFEVLCNNKRILFHITS